MNQRQGNGNQNARTEAQPCGTGDGSCGGGEEGGCREWRWVTATELDTLGLSSGVRKIQTLIGKKEKTVKVKVPGESAIGKMFAAKKAKTGE